MTQNKTSLVRQGYNTPYNNLHTHGRTAAVATDFTVSKRHVWKLNSSCGRPMPATVAAPVNGSDGLSLLYASALRVSSPRALPHIMYIYDYTSDIPAVYYGGRDNTTRMSAQCMLVHSQSERLGFSASLNIYVASDELFR